MLFCPGLLDQDLVDRLTEAPLGDDGDREPLDAIGGLDPVPIVPVTLHVLHTVVDDVLVALPDQVEKTLPGNVAGLDDRDAHLLCPPRFHVVKTFKNASVDFPARTGSDGEAFRARTPSRRPLAVPGTPIGPNLHSLHSLSSTVEFALQPTS